METIAVYWEPKIKTYGFQYASDLCMLELSFQFGQMAAWGLRIQELGELGISFDLVLVQQSGGQGLEFYLVFPRQWEDSALNYFHQIIQEKGPGVVRTFSPVDLIHFSGPHFGDRYGIAEAAFTALANRGVPVLASACSASCIYLVLPEKRAEEAGEALAEVFEAAPNSRLPL
ncbi:MAG: hypothetical protein SV487_05705 [Thermodesulfobacteriota bacterium]|nr:hypothetical protein [Thermodesulfobacteriota bacterium]